LSESGCPGFKDLQDYFLSGGYCEFIIADHVKSSLKIYLISLGNLRKKVRIQDRKYSKSGKSRLLE
jgi:hypothetical protein